MPDPGNEAELSSRLARSHGVSESAVDAVLDALRRGGGLMVQLSHADFGGMSQWSSGMTMVGDMFNDSLKAKLDAIATELSAYLRDHPTERSSDDTSVMPLPTFLTLRLSANSHSGPIRLRVPRG